MKKLILLLIVGSIVVHGEAAISETETKTNAPASAETNVIPDDIAIQHAMTEFKSLSRVERKAKTSEVKKMLATYKAQKASGNSDVSTNQVLLAILAILLPPLAVGLHEGQLNGKFWLSVLLTLLFWLPGVVYALIVVLS
ncbi:MAG: YqaE/Pmp3 family membrane protein [Sediminibacterium sp.]|nr:YqaE/Pmp3 family membrane protein [Sediminibacterium sp.]MBX9780268.1 YqaE/Pmp3 family membrane protein [Chitinophagaceae bacterium]